MEAAKVFPPQQVCPVSKKQLTRFSISQKAIKKNVAVGGENKVLQLEVFSLVKKKKNSLWFIPQGSHLLGCVLSKLLLGINGIFMPNLFPPC